MYSMIAILLDFGVHGAASGGVRGRLVPVRFKSSRLTSFKDN